MHCVCIALALLPLRLRASPVCLHLRFAGNLLVLPDGRVGFLDFGIVGRISEATWRGLEALLVATSTQDYSVMVGAAWVWVGGIGGCCRSPWGSCSTLSAVCTTIPPTSTSTLHLPSTSTPPPPRPQTAQARALGSMGATDADVDYDAFARDLESFFSELDALQGSLVVAAAPPSSLGGEGGIAAGLDIDQAAANRLALELVRIGESHGVRFPPDFGECLCARCGSVWGAGGVGEGARGRRGWAADCGRIPKRSTGLQAGALTGELRVDPPDPPPPPLSHQVCCSSSRCTLTGTCAPWLRGCRC